MSIEMDKPETLLEKIDALTNWIEQMSLAHRIRDEARFRCAHEAAAGLGFEITQMVEETESKIIELRSQLHMLCDIGDTLTRALDEKDGPP